jgi:MoxR-like ATPase
MPAAIKKQTQKSSDNTHAPSPQAKFVTAAKEMKASLIERDSEVDLSLTAMISQYHICLVGIPGVAKSLLVNSLQQWVIGARKCVVHCCKDTSRSMAFGPVKLSALKHDKHERVLEGGLADSEFCVLEEVYKSGPAVLDMYLLLMNERSYREGVFQAKTPLRFLMGTGNEWSPEGCEAALAAFFDRFLFRKEVKAVSRTQGRRELLKRAVDNDNCEPKFSSHITLEEIDQAHAEAMQLPLSPEAKKALWQILEELDREGICPGDRRIKQSVPAVRAAAYLAGSQVVKPEHLEVLAHVLWIDPTEQPAKCQKIVSRIANPTGAKIMDLLGQVESIVEKVRLAPSREESRKLVIESVAKLQAIQGDLETLPEVPQQQKALEHVTDILERAIGQSIGRKDKSLEDD